MDRRNLIHHKLVYYPLCAAAALLMFALIMWLASKGLWWGFAGLLVFGIFILMRSDKAVARRADNREYKEQVRDQERRDHGPFD